MNGLIITGDSYGPSPVSGGAPSPPLMIEGPRRPPSAPVGRRIDPYGEWQWISSPSLIFATVGRHPSVITSCPSIFSPLAHLTSLFLFSSFTFLSSSFYFLPVLITSCIFLVPLPSTLFFLHSFCSFVESFQICLLLFCCLLHLFFFKGSKNIFSIGFSVKC